MVVVFHPEVFRCTPQEARAARALQRLVQEMPAIEVVTVLPPGTGLSGAVYDEDLPGRSAEVSALQFEELGKFAPRPRLEVWDRAGRLLHLVSLHSAITEDGVFDSVLWSRSFTRPMGE